MFKYTTKAYRNDSDEEDVSDDDNFGNAKGKEKKTKRKKSDVPASKRRNIAVKSAVDVRGQRDLLMNNDDNDSDDCVIVEKAVVARSIVSELLARSAVEVKFDQVPSNVVDDENIRKAKEMLSQIGSAKLLLDVDEDVRVQPVQASTIILPTVRIRGTVERIPSTVGLEVVSAESLLDSLFTSSSSAPAPVDNGPPKIKVKTRLNGKLERGFKIGTTDKFEKLREALSRLYCIDESLITMKFDGDSLDDDQTPEDVDMEDDNMIDVFIPKDKFEAAKISFELAAEKRINPDVSAAQHS